MVKRIKYVHSKHHIHRDIKPDNFMMGKDENEDKLYIIDFGLAKKYYSTTKHQHIKFCKGKSWTGTARYCSRNAHRGFEQSRRDDVESIGYVLMYFLLGILPWQGLKCKQGEDQFEKIAEKKNSTPFEDLCKGQPKEFLAYFKHTDSLGFEEEPKYDYLIGLFQEVINKYCNDCYYDFDWKKTKCTHFSAEQESSNTKSRDASMIVNANDKSQNDDSINMQKEEKENNKVENGWFVNSGKELDDSFDDINEESDMCRKPNAGNTEITAGIIRRKKDKKMNTHISENHVKKKHCFNIEKTQIDNNEDDNNNNNKNISGKQRPNSKKLTSHKGKKNKTDDNLNESARDKNEFNRSSTNNSKKSKGRQARHCKSDKFDPTEEWNKNNNDNNNDSNANTEKNMKKHKLKKMASINDKRVHNDNENPKSEIKESDIKLEEIPSKSTVKEEIATDSNEKKKRKSITTDDPSSNANTKKMNNSSSKSQSKAEPLNDDTKCTCITF